MAVLEDSKNSNIATSGTTCDVSITIAANSDRALFALVVYALGAQNFATGVTQGVGGTAFTEIGKTNNDGREAQAWCLLNPSSGTHTIRATVPSTISGDVALFVYSLYNVNQTTPYDNFNFGFTDNPFTLAGSDSDGRILFGMQTGGGGTFSGDISTYDFVQSNSGVEYALSNKGDGTSISVTFSSTVRGWCGLNVKASAAGESPAPAMMGAMMF